MQLEELVNQYYDDLNENDLMIWKYICLLYTSPSPRDCS